MRTRRWCCILFIAEFHDGDPPRLGSTLCSILVVLPPSPTPGRIPIVVVWPVGSTEMSLTRVVLLLPMAATDTVDPGRGGGCGGCCGWWWWWSCRGDGCGGWVGDGRCVEIKG